MFDIRKLHDSQQYTKIYSTYSRSGGWKEGRKPMWVLPPILGHGREVPR